MRQTLLYLRPDVQAEPLFDSWYAWAQLIAPANAARNITHRHLKLMDSYISAPQFHANALKDPAMVGGPFIDHGGQRVDEIKALREATRRDRADLIELSAALSELDAKLMAHPRGFSLQPAYAAVPDLLKGYVELVYDLHHNPSFRVIEGLLYKSKYYQRSAQSLMLSITRGDHRSFVFSTPRLEGEDLFNWRMPFDHENVDRFFRLETEPQPWEAIREIIGPMDGREDLVRSFFTTEAPRPSEPYRGDKVRWRYFGHACVMIEAAGMSFLFDPVASYDGLNDPPRYTYRDLPDRIDYVLLTHNHQDHVVFETLLKIRHKIDTIVIPRSSGGLQDPSLKLILQSIGFTRVIELDEMETLQAGPCRVTGLPFLGEHSDLQVLSKIAYRVEVGRHSMLFAVDSCNHETRMYQHIRDAAGPVDTLFLGMECDGAPLSWLYGPLLMEKVDRKMDESRRLNGSGFKEAKGIVDCLQCKQAYVYAMGQEPWLSHVMGLKYTPESRPITESNRLIQACREQGIGAERLYGHKEVFLDP